MLVDLTRTFIPSMPVYPGDDAVRLYQTRNIPEDDYTNYRIESGMHVGTHLDGPLHMTTGSPFISEIPIDRFFGRGVLIDVRGKSEINFEETFFVIHKLLFKANILIIENLTNLEPLLQAERFEVYVFPLKIQADSAPARVIARVV